MGRAPLPCTPEYHKPNSVARYDARGIFLARTCKLCHDTVMSKYRPEVLTDPNYWHDEPIDED